MKNINEKLKKIAKKMLVVLITKDGYNNDCELDGILSWLFWIYFKDPNLINVSIEEIVERFRKTQFYKVYKPKK